MTGPVLEQLNLIVGDMDASLAFYRALGIDGVWRTGGAPHHVEVEQPNGFELAIDTPTLAKVYDRGWTEASRRGVRSVLGVRVATREEVDRLHEKLTALGHPSAQPPYDTFWGSRFAIVEDPDGNHVGIMSPPDPARRSEPPALGSGSDTGR